MGRGTEAFPELLPTMQSGSTHDAHLRLRRSVRSRCAAKKSSRLLLVRSRCTKVVLVCKIDPWAYYFAWLQGRYSVEFLASKVASNG